MNTFLKKATAESFARLLNWARIFLPSFILTDEMFGELIQIVTYEALLGGIASYFGTKYILINQKKQSKIFLYIICFFLVSFFTLIFYLTAEINFINIFLSSLFFSFFQLELYSMRVKDRSYSIFRALSSILSTIIFLILLLNNYLFIDYYFLVPFSSLIVAFIFQRNDHISRVNIKDVFKFIYTNTKDFANLTLVSMSTNTWAYGLRILVTYLLSVEMLGIYSKPQLIASAITFLFAINMMIFEPTIYKEKLDNRVRFFFSSTVLKVLIANFAISISYIFIFSFIKLSSIDNLFLENFKDIYLNELFFIFIAAFTAHGLYLPLSSKMIALGGSKYSLICIGISIFSMFTFLFFRINDINLIDFAYSYLISELILLLTVYISLKKIYGKK